MKALAMTQRQEDLKRIRLELARSKEFPNGSTAHGYEFVAPLDGEAHIDPALWRQHRDRCRVRRFWDEEAEVGHLVHRPGGSEHAQWVFDYDRGVAEHDDETGYRFGAQKACAPSSHGLRDYGDRDELAAMQQSRSQRWPARRPLGEEHERNCRK
jgi:hypothetical protein